MEAIANREFNQGRRGYEPAEVRRFLTAVSNEIAHLRSSVEDLQGRLAAAERQPRPAATEPAAPPVLTEEQVVAAVGEEMAGILRTAHAAASDLKTKAAAESERIVTAARERAAAINAEADDRLTSAAADADARVAKAKTDAEERLRRARADADERLRTSSAQAEERDRTSKAEAEERVRVATAEAEERVTQATGMAEELVSAARETATKESRQIVGKARIDADTVRQQAETDRRATVEGAQAIRERILGDLARRRRVATVQIEQLRAGRERLLESYAVVRRTLEEVHDELQRADAEARAAADEAGRRLQAEGAAGPVAGAVSEAEVPPVDLPEVDTVVVMDRETPETPPSPPAPADGVPADAVPEDAAPADAVPADAVPEDAVPADAVPADAVPADVAPVSGAPVVEAAPADPAPVSEAPAVDSTPTVESTPAADSAPVADSAPTDAASGASASGDAAVEATAPVESTAPVEGSGPAGAGAVGEDTASGAAVGQHGAVAADDEPDDDGPPSGGGRSGPGGDRPDGPGGRPAVGADGGAAVAAGGAASRSRVRIMRVGGDDAARPSPSAMAAPTAVAHLHSLTDGSSAVAIQPELTAVAPDEAEAARPAAAPAPPRPAAPLELVPDLPPAKRPAPVRAGAAKRNDDGGAGIVRSDADEAQLQRRDADIDALVTALTRRVKRALQDEHNDLLDRLRGVKGSPSLVRVVPPADAQIEAYGRIIATFVADAAASAVRAAPAPGGGADPAPVVAATEHLAVDAARQLVLPLRERLGAVLSDLAGEPHDALVDALASVYREARSQRVERLAGDTLSSAYAQAVWHAAPAGTPLRWVADDADGPCADCDDNVLAGPVERGEAYPTGQLHPPAHDGCRCLLVTDPG